MWQCSVPGGYVLIMTQVSNYWLINGIIHRLAWGTSPLRSGLRWRGALCEVWGLPKKGPEKNVVHLGTIAALSVGKVFGSSHSQVPQANQKKPGVLWLHLWEMTEQKLTKRAWQLFVAPGSCSWRICRFPMFLRPGKQQIFRRWLELEEASLICKDFSGSTTLDERKQRSKTWTALMIPKCHEICWCVGFDFCLDLIQN